MPEAFAEQASMRRRCALEQSASAHGGRRTGLAETREMEATDGTTERFHVDGGA
jgi:hypothetical protein